MNIVVTMSGEGRRFKDIGFDIPKHEIEVKGKTLFEWAILSLTNFFDQTMNLLHTLMPILCLQMGLHIIM